MADSAFLFDALNRRDFIRRAGGCSALTSISLMSTLLSLRTTNCLAANLTFANDDYKALVCVFKFGGNDGFNMLIPNEDSEFTNYERKRSNMALEQSEILPIQDSTGRKFGVHPSLTGIQSIYNQGDAAFVANVGALVQPTTLKDVQDKKSLPLGLYSHSDLQRHWQTSVPQERTGLQGWAGRVADCLTDASNTNPAVSMNFALEDSPIMLTGGGVIPYILGTKGATTISDYGRSGRRGRITTNATDQILSQTYTNLLQKTHAAKRRVAIDAAVNFNQSTRDAEVEATFPGTSLGRQLEMVARTIASRKALGQKRQIFFVSRGGFDNHNELLNNQGRLLTEFDDAVKAFHGSMQAQGLNDKVTLFTASDFARTLSSNGNGTDHAWGSNHLMVGGAVKGGDIYGQYPRNLRDPVGLVEGSETDLEAGGGRGRLIPTTSVDEYNAALAMWFGIPNDDTLKLVLPNIENFMRLGRRPRLRILG